MNIHEKIEAFLNSSAKTKWGAGVFVLTFIALMLGGAYWLGQIHAREAADSEYLQKREETLQKARDAEIRANFYLEESQKHAKENEALKRQNEIQAEILRANDAQIKGDARKLDEIFQEGQRRNEEIISDTRDVDAQFCSLCNELKSAGFANLSQCGRCEAAPPRGR
jgi:uncharacterized protein HemX